MNRKINKPVRVVTDWFKAVHIVLLSDSFYKDNKKNINKHEINNL